jgi:hemerythrin superfamily protein
MADEFTDAIALLKADHRTVEELFEKFENARPGSKQSIAEQICNELKIHTMIEEELFYPALEGKIAEDTLNEAYVEHDGAKVLINDIMAGRRAIGFQKERLAPDTDRQFSLIKETPSGTGDIGPEQVNRTSGWLT